MEIKIATLKESIKDLEGNSIYMQRKIIENSEKIAKLQIAVQEAENYAPKPAGKFKGEGMSQETIEELGKKV